jgi:hypothetical protein
MSIHFEAKGKTHKGGLIEPKLYENTIENCVEQFYRTRGRRRRFGDTSMLHIFEELWKRR